jgi:colanic acid biosynthesis glycosyl transferase WcaI
MNYTSDLFTVIQAARMLRSAEPGIEFVICGEGPKLKALQRAARDLHNVRFVGWVNQSEMTVLMEWSDVGLAAYAAGAPQSVPNKPIEYLSASLPLVSSLPGELARLIHRYRCGRNYQAGDAVELARVLKEMTIAGDETAAIRSNADRLFQRHFDAGQVYDQMIDDLFELRAASCPMAA